MLQLENTRVRWIERNAKGQLLELYTDVLEFWQNFTKYALLKLQGYYCRLGIPNDAENRKTMEAQTASTTGL
jgi:hypothetical protein